MSNSKTYEGMFLVQSGSDFHAASQPVTTVLERSDAEVLSMNPWEERRLAYEIKGQKRGLYILTYFKMDPANLSELHRDSELNEGILRMMILRRDKITEEEINADTPAQAGQRQAEAAEAAAQAVPAEDAPATDAATAEEAPAAEAPAETAPAAEQEAPAEVEAPEQEAPADAGGEAEAPVEAEIVEPDAEPKAADEG